jgi:hypothetical protein
VAEENLQRENLAKQAEELSRQTREQDQALVQEMEEEGKDMKKYFNNWKQTDTDVYAPLEYIIDYNADKIYGPGAAQAMRETLEATFFDDTFLEAFDENTTLAELRPVLLDLFPLCELNDLTDEQFQASVPGPTLVQSTVEYLASWLPTYGGETKTKHSDDCNKVKVMLSRMLLPAKTGLYRDMYQPSTEVLRFEGIVDGKKETKLLSFKDDKGNMRYFNQKLAQKFKSVDRMIELSDTKPATIKKAIQAGDLVKSSFFITGKNNIYEMITDDTWQKNEVDTDKRLGQKYARSKGWVLPKAAVDKDTAARAKNPPNTESTSNNEIVAESKYPIPIPAGELSAMLAELSSMENTSDSEYASETEFEEFASEEFASDSEEFASDDF